MGQPPCKHLTPQYGWRDDHRGAASDKMMSDAEPVLLGHACGWADNHPERLVDIPHWMQIEMLNAPGFRDRHCDGCRCYEPVDRLGG